MKKSLCLIISTLTAAMTIVSCKPEIQPEPTPGTQPEQNEPKPAERSISFKNTSGDTVDKIVFDVNKGTLSFDLTVEANYYWDMDMTSSPWPSWITKPGRTEGKAGADGIYRNTFTLSLNEEEAGEGDKTAEITFIDLDDETFKQTLAVEYVAKIIVDQEFKINCNLGTEIHITPNGNYKDKDGNVIATQFWLDFNVEVEDFSEFQMVYWDAVSFDTNWRSTVNKNDHYFLQYTDSDNKRVDYPHFIGIQSCITDPTNPKAFSVFLAPGAFSHQILKMYNFNMGYIMFLPERVWKPVYDQIVDKRQLFTRLMIANAIATPGEDSEGKPYYEIKENLRKYVIRIYVDNE